MKNLKNKVKKLTDNVKFLRFGKDTRSRERRKKYGVKEIFF